MVRGMPERWEEVYEVARTMDTVLAEVEAI